MSEQRGVYGGQAVIEGVMMRGPKRMAIAVRRPDGEIAIREEEIKSVTHRYPILRLPILRGMVALVETMKIGMSALSFSASQAFPDEEQLSSKEMALTSVGGVVLAIGLFVVLPTFIGGLVKNSMGSSLLTNAVEAVMRLAIFIGYLAIISLMKDIQRVYQYHGAEHKVINTYEAGDPLTVEACRRHSREHKRCGTSFLLYVVVISILVFSIFRIDNMALKMVIRIIMLPFVAGISFEFIRLMGRYDNALVNLISRPGMWLQGLTTREPDDSQLEVAIASFETARGHGLPG